VSPIGSDVDPLRASKIASLQGLGRPLSRSVRDFFEPRFGYDFSQVRVHTSTKAAQTAQELKAKAYTFRNHVVVQPAYYSPHTIIGRRLLAHELTHVIQQRNAASDGTTKWHSVSSDKRLQLIQCAPVSSPTVSGKRRRSGNPQRVTAGGAPIVKAFSKSNPAQWDYDDLIKALDIIWEVRGVASELKYIIKSQKWDLKRILKAVLYHDIQRKTAQPAHSSKMISLIFADMRWLGTKINAFVHNAKLIQNLLLDYKNNQNPNPLGKWLNTELLKLRKARRRSPRRLTWHMKYLLRILRGKHLFKNDVDYKTLFDITEQVHRFKQLPERLSTFTDILSGGFRRRRRRRSSSRILTFYFENAKLDFQAIESMIKIIKRAKQIPRWRRKPRLRRSIYRVGYYLPKLKAAFASFDAQKIIKAKRAHYVLQSYLRALRILPKNYARRAAIEYQKLLSTVNVRYTWEWKFEPGSKRLIKALKRTEGTQAGALAMTRWLSASVIRILKPKLARKIDFGTYPGLSTYTAAKGSAKFKHPRSKRTGRFRRGYSSHDYGALDVVSRAGNQITLCLRQEIHLDELPESGQIIPSTYPKASRKFRLTKAKVDPKRTAITYETVDLANKLLRSLKYRRGRMVSIERLKRFWSALTFRKTSEYQPWSDWKRGGQNATGKALNPLRKQYLSLRKSFLTIAEKAGLTPQVASRKVNVDTGNLPSGDLNVAYKYLYRHLIEPQYQIQDLARKYGKRRYRYVLANFLRRHGDISHHAACNELLYKYKTLGDRHYLSRFIMKMYKTTGKRKWWAYYWLYMYLPFLRIEVKGLEKEVQRWRKKPGISTSNHTAVIMEYSGPQVPNQDQFKVEGVLYMTHMYSLSQDVLQGSSININNPRIIIGKVGTTGSSFVPHVHYGAKYKLINLTQNYSVKQPIEVPCSPIVYLANKP